LVYHDGYALEFRETSTGYRVEFNDVSYIIKGDANDVWHIYDEVTDEPLADWLPAQRFTITVAGEQIVYQRLYIPNVYAISLLTGTNTTINIRIYAGLETVPLDGVPSTYNPLFAPTALNLIRSPRHIENIRRALGGTYVQQLNVNFAIYRTELMMSGTNYVTNPATQTLESYTSAVVTGTFTGSYNGNARWIAGVVITGSGSNVGLFEINEGTIRQVTMRNPVISGGDNVGAIAGRNNSTGSITFCSVQAIVPVEIINIVAQHPITVTGSSHVGGIVGYNAGVLNNVSFVSASGRQAVLGTGAGSIGNSIGGIVGTTTTEVYNMLYLAVAPSVRLPGGEQQLIRPFTGTNTFVGNNSYYLAGTRGLRPAETLVGSIYRSDYNQITDLQPGGAGNTRVLATGPNPMGWQRNTVTADQSVLETNTVYPYLYPTGTVQPDNRNWPIVDDIYVTSTIVYYENYVDELGRPLPMGVWAPEHGDTDGFLNRNAIITEAGYLILDRGTTSSNNWWWYFTWNGTAWVNQGRQGSWSFNQAAGIQVPYIPGNFFVLPLNDLSRIEGALADSSQPIVVWMNSQGSLSSNPFGVAMINPLFAKQVYPVTFSGTTITSPMPAIRNISIRTPWQMQNMTHLTTANTTNKTFIQGMNLDFTQYLTAPPAATARIDGVRPVITTTTSSIANIPGAGFAGTYEGSGRYISNINLIGTAGSKGLFSTIASVGTIQNITMYNSRFQNGNNNGGFASVNNGTIQDVVFVSNLSSAPVSAATATNAGGIAWTNSGTIRNALYLARAPGSADGSTGNPIAAAASTGLTENAFYLSGTVSANNRPTEIPAPSIYNDYFTAHGEPMTTQELNAFTGFSFPWLSPLTYVPIESNTMLSTLNPYPYMGYTPTATWPVATSEAYGIAYYEVYSNGAMGFFPQVQPGLPGLNNNNLITVLDSGYCAIVPRAGGYSVKMTNLGANSHIAAGDYNEYYYVIIPPDMLANNTQEIYVNDEPTGSFVNSLFAKGVYTSNAQAQNPGTVFIRMPQQMRNITYISTTGRTFIQERNLDFTNYTGANLNNLGAVVTGGFNGIYDGGGNMISGVSINYVQPGATPPPTSNVGLFSSIGAEGSVSRLTLSFNDTSTWTTQISASAYTGSGGGTVYVGALAGTNAGTVSDISVVSAKYDTNEPANALPPVTGTNGANAGGVIGLNSGSVARVLFLAPAPVDSIDPTTIYPIVYYNDTAAVPPATVVDAYFLQGLIPVLPSEPDPAGIIDSSGTWVVLSDGYNNATANIGVGGTTDDLTTSINWTADGWTPSRIPPIDFVNFIYPYPGIIRTQPGTTLAPSTIVAWPVVSSEFIPPTLLAAPIELELFNIDGEDTLTSDNAEPEGDNTGSDSMVPDDIDTNETGSDGTNEIIDEDNDLEDSKSDSGDTEEPKDTGEIENDKNDQNAEDNNDTETDEPGIDSFDETIMTEGAVFAMGFITIYGGYSFLRAKPLRKYIRKSNARAIRRINEYNTKKRRKPS